MAQMYWIIPVEGGSPGQPTHPIAPGGPPLGIWGGAPPYVDIGGPGSQPHPSHPIAPGGRPPGIWGGPPTYPDQGLPGQQPGVWPSPGHPSHPIYGGGGGQPPGFWGGTAPPMPDQGLPPGGEEIPPDQLPLPEPPEDHKDDLVIAVYRPGQGWEVQAYDVQPDQGQPQPTPHRR